MISTRDTQVIVVVVVLFLLGAAAFWFLIQWWFITLPVLAALVALCVLVYRRNRPRVQAPAATVPSVDLSPAQRATYLVVSQQFASPSMLQKRMGVTRDEAQQILSKLEAFGVVGPVPPTGTRPVLVPATELGNLFPN